eukprot:TRINITY_DN69633_c0_g1_i1.p1 TRINITY_DN69633_c0_g1~~TRINITY_DN69633_c0_g1_i1.p1  ORF type:complete len:273 (+),score=33.85 TRINITY_DN69633_c0_g1_i1:40-858(+)
MELATPASSCRPGLLHFDGQAFNSQANSCYSDCCRTRSEYVIVVSSSRGQNVMHSIASGSALAASVRRRRRRQSQRKLAVSSMAALECFGVAEIPGRGVGVVATRDISVGELVLAESPVISFRGSDIWWMRDAQAQFDSLPPRVQEQILSLCDAFQLVDEIFPGGVHKTLEGILKTNAYMRGSKSDDGVLCLTTSRFNHSCVANLSHRWDEELLQHVVYANTNIATGDELCTDYLDPLTEKSERRQLLFEKYGFFCDCAACSTFNVQMPALC